MTFNQIIKTLFVCYLDSKFWSYTETSSSTNLKLYVFYGNVYYRGLKCHHRRQPLSTIHTTDLSDVQYNYWFFIFYLNRCFAIQ